MLAAVVIDLRRMQPVEPQVGVRVMEGVEGSVAWRVEHVGNAFATVHVLDDDVGARRRALVPEESDADATCSSVCKESQPACLLSTASVVARPYPASIRGP
jgi:hypothetical protein